MAPIAGALEYWQRKSEPTALGVLQGFVPNEVDAWQFTLAAHANYSGRALAYRPEGTDQGETSGLSALLAGDLLSMADDRIGHNLDLAGLLGQRTAQPHLALAA